MLEKIMNIVFGSQSERDLKQLLPILHAVNEKESWAMTLPSDRFPSETERLKERLVQGETLDAILPEAFALVREAARRTLSERPYDVQVLGGIVLHQGKIMEMKTGEGKTLSSVSAAYLNALTGNGVHVVTVNDYLAERDANWMRPIYSFLGLTVGSILSNMDNEARKISYNCDITYATNNELGFDYLRDNMNPFLEGRVQRGHNYCIVDEIDSILIDEARTPLIISGSAEDDTRQFTIVNNIVPLLIECAKDPSTGEYPEEPIGDFKMEEKNKRIIFTDTGMNHIEELLIKRGVIKDTIFSEENFEYVHYITQAMRAHKLFHKDVDYVVQDGLVQIVDEFTGRILHGRRYSDGLHQAIEAKERIRVAQRNRTLATITFQNYFRMYNKISGMTGTADTEAKEFSKIYNLEVVVVPTNRPLVRMDEDDIIFLNENDKFRAIVEEIRTVHQIGQPVLVGTVSIEKSELLSKLLTSSGIRHEVLNAKNHAREALIISEAGSKGAVTIATNMAGRGTDIKLGGNPEFRARKRAGTEATEEEYRAAYAKELESWRKDYEEVKNTGGLYILGTERHESRRIDNQLRGRSGRQGDPGRSRFFISLDDDLMRLFGGENLKSLMARVGMKDGEPIYHPWINNALEKAQRRVEDRNFEIRKHLLEYDDVLNEQRKFIYTQRDAILHDKELHNRIYTAAEERVSDIVDEAFRSTADRKTTASNILQELKTEFFYAPSANTDQIKNMSPDQVKTLILDDLKADLDEKVNAIGQERLTAFIRYEYLRNIDQKWQDHLENLESLREAVYLRAYGQKNPLLEYKIEGFQIFDKLIQDIRSVLVRKVFSIKLVNAEQKNPMRESPAMATASHQAMGQFAGSGAAERMHAAQAMPSQIQVRNAYPKVGRNDICPCGSGKKYKYCHGK